jgi:hypothetical protein
MRRTISIIVAACALAAVIPATALAVDYPPPTNPGSAQPKPKGPFKTLKVCPKLTKKAKKAGCKYTFVQKAVDKAKPGDTVKVADGTYKEGVLVVGKSKRYVKLIGNEKHPTKVVFDGDKIPKKVKYKATSLPKGTTNDYPTQKANAIEVNGANHVVMSGFSAKHYLGNCFFVVNNGDGYTMKNLNATLCGTYGIYVFNSVGGSIKDSVSSQNDDGGYYIGQTPPQLKPKFTQVTNIISHTNVLGWSGTNMRYVTIKNSYFYNNGAGLVPNAETGEKYAPPEMNTISGNKIFNNNFDYYAGSPFKLRPTDAAGIPFPVGVGVLIFGGHDNTVDNNQVFGNKLVGLGMIAGLEFDTAKDDRGILHGNTFTGNVLGNGGKNRNGRDLFYDGNGYGNCFKDNTAVQTTLPAMGTPAASLFTAGCASPTTPNGFDQASQSAALNWVAMDNKEAGWITYPAAPVADPEHPGQTVPKQEKYVGGKWQ